MKDFYKLMARVVCVRPHEFKKTRVKSDGSGGPRRCPYPRFAFHLDLRPKGFPGSD